MLKIGIAGVRGLSTIDGFRACEGVEVSALCDLDEALLNDRKNKLGIPQAYRVFDDMLESDIDEVRQGLYASRELLLYARGSSRR